jgi:hypothetical protein
MATTTTVPATKMYPTFNINQSPTLLFFPFISSYGNHHYSTATAMTTTPRDSTLPIPNLKPTRHVEAAARARDAIRLEPQVCFFLSSFDQLVWLAPPPQYHPTATTTTTRHPTFNIKQSPTPSHLDMSKQQQGLETRVVLSPRYVLFFFSCFIFY